MKMLLVFLYIILLFSPQHNSSGQQPILPIAPGKFDTIQKALVVVDSAYLNKVVDQINKNNEKILKATIPLKKSDENLNTSVKKLETYIDKKEDVIKTPTKTTAKEIKKKTLWQKIGSIFKSKNKNNGKNNR